MIKNRKRRACVEAKLTHIVAVSILLHNHITCMYIYCRFSVNASKWQVEFIEKQDDKVSTTV